MLRAQFFLMFIFLCWNSFASACSCGKKSAETIAHTDGIVLTKLKISTPSIIERLRLFALSSNHERIYSVEVIENYKGEFISKNIRVNANVDGGACGFSLVYGDILNIVAQKNGDDLISNYVGVCNIVSDEFVEMTTKEIKNPSKAYNSVEVSSWKQFYSSGLQTFYADTKRITKNNYGSYIWILMNDSSTLKSQKTRLHILCREKVFSIDHEVGFSEFDAKGKILTANNFGKQGQYEWLSLTDIYSKLLKYTC
jgi:hypothetical protein